MLNVLMARNAIRSRLLPTLGPFAVAGGNLSIALLAARHLPSTEYGILSFLIVIIQFLAGLCNALVVTPMTVGPADDMDVMLAKGLPPIAWINAAIAGVSLIAVAISLGAGPLATMEAAVLASFQSLRWTSRGFALAQNKIVLAFRADAMLATITVIGAAVLAIAGCFTLNSALLVIIVGSIVSFGLLPKKWLFENFNSVFGYKEIWLAQSRWSLLGVVSTEAVSNAFSYAITAISGATAFAPIAFASLFWRPFAICVSALTPLERMKASRDLRLIPNKPPKAVLELLFVLLVVVMATAGGSFIALPTLINHFPKFDIVTVFQAFLSMSIAMAIRAFREPLSILWQAQNRFKPLSLAITIAGAVTTLLSVLICMYSISAFAPIAVAVGEAGLVAYLFFNRWAAGKD